MEVRNTDIVDLFIIKPEVYGDSRGYFTETFNAQQMENAGLPTAFVQDNQSFSKFGTLRGLHYQVGRFAQTKLIRVTRGKILDVAVDIRNASPTFGKHYAVELSDENFLQMLVPKGFAHGFVVLSDEAVVQYKCDCFYSPENERGIRFDDPQLGIDWLVPEGSLLLSDKDKAQPYFKDIEPQ